MNIRKPLFAHGAEIRLKSSPRQVWKLVIRPPPVAEEYLKP